MQNSDCTTSWFCIYVLSDNETSTYYTSY